MTCSATFFGSVTALVAIAAGNYYDDGPEPVMEANMYFTVDESDRRTASSEIFAEKTCYENVRCIGAPKVAYVLYKPCCDPDAECVSDERAGKSSAK